MKIVTVHCSICEADLTHNQAEFGCDNCGSPFYDSGTADYWRALHEDLGDERYELYCEAIDRQREEYGDWYDRPQPEY